MPSAVAGLVGLQVGPLIAIMTTALSMAFVLVVSAHLAGIGHKGEGKSFMLSSPSLSTGEKADIKLNMIPLPNCKSSEREYVKAGRGARAFRHVRRFLEADGLTFRPAAGSTPPNCDGKCQGCTPCELQPIVIPHMVIVSSVEYKYEHWACVCNTAMYLASTRT